MNKHMRPVLNYYQEVMNRTTDIYIVYLQQFNASTNMDMDMDMNIRVISMDSIIEYGRLQTVESVRREHHGVTSLFVIIICL